MTDTLNQWKLPSDPWLLPNNIWQKPCVEPTPLMTQEELDDLTKKWKIIMEETDTPAFTFKPVDTPSKIVDTSHYDKFVVKLTEAEIEAGELRLDPYRVADEWKIGVRDPSGALFHILKTICRTKEGNSIMRELHSIKATIVRLIELRSNS